MFVHLFQQYLTGGFGLEGEVERERERDKEGLELLPLNLHCHCKQLGRRLGLNSPLYGDHPAEGCGAFSQLFGGWAPSRMCRTTYIDVYVDVGAVQNLDLAGDYLSHRQRSFTGSRIGERLGNSYNRATTAV